MRRLTQLAMLGFGVIVTTTLLQGCAYEKGATGNAKHSHSMMYGTQAGKNLAVKTGYPKPPIGFGG